MNFSPDVGISPALSVESQVSSRPPQGDTEYSVIRKLRERLRDFISSAKGEFDTRAQREYLMLEGTEKTGNVSGETLVEYSSKAKEIYLEFEEKLHNLELTPEIVTNTLKFAFNRMLFSRDSEVRMAAFLDMHIMFDSFNRKLIEMTDKFGCMDSMNTKEGKDRVLTIMFYQGMVSNILRNVQFEVVTENGKHTPKSGVVIIDDFIRSNSKNIGKDIEGLVKKARNQKIDIENAVNKRDFTINRFFNLLLSRSLTFEERYSRKTSKNLDVDSIVAELHKKGLLALADSQSVSGILSRNYLDMHIHIVNNEITRKDFDLIRSGNNEETPIEREIVDQELLNEDKYFISDDLDSFRRMTEFVGFNVDGSRGLTLATTMNFMFPDIKPSQLLLKLTSETKPSNGDAKVDEKNKQSLDEYLDYMQQTYVDSSTGQLMEKGARYRENAGNYLKTIYESYWMLQNNKKSKLVITQRARGIYNNDGRYYFYFPEPTDFSELGGSARTSLDRLAAARYRAYLAAALCGPHQSVDHEGKGVPYKVKSEKKIDGSEFVKIKGSELVTVKFVDELGRRRETRFRRSNLTFRLYNKVIEKTSHTPGPIMDKVASMPSSLLNPTVRVPIGLEMFFTAKPTDNVNFQGFLMGTFGPNDMDKDLSTYTLESLNDERINERLFRSPADPGAVGGNVLVLAVDTYLRWCLAFRQIYDRGGYLWPVGSNEDGIKDPNVMYTLREYTTNLTRLTGAAANELSRIFSPQAIKEWKDVADKVKKILGTWLGLYPSKEKAPVNGIFNELFFEAVRTYRETFQNIHDLAVDQKDAFMGTLSKVIANVVGDPALESELFTVYGDRRSESLINVGALPELERKAAIYEIVFLSRFFYKRLQYPIGQLKDGKSRYKSLIGNKVLAEQTLSAAEVWGLTHLFRDSSLLKPEVVRERKTLLKDTAKIFTDNGIRFFAERFGDSKEVRFTIDPEYVMETGYGTTFGREVTNFQALNVELAQIIDSNSRYHVDPFNSYRIVYELSKLVAREKDSSKRDSILHVAGQWIDHLNQIDVSPLHSSRPLRGGIYSDKKGNVARKPSRMTVEDTIESAFIGKMSLAEVLLWSEIQFNSITMQIGSIMGTSEDYLDYASIAGAIQLYQRTADGVATVTNKVTNPNHRYNYPQIEKNGYTSFRKHFSSVLGVGRQGSHGESSGDILEFEGRQYIQEGNNSNHIMELFRDIYDEVHEINLGLENPSTLASSEAKAAELVKKYPDLFALEKTDRENKAAKEVLKIIMPTHQVNPIFYLVSELWRDSNSFANLLILLDAESNQLGGKQEISLSNMFFNVVNKIKKMRFAAEVNSGREAMNKSKGNVSVLRALSRYIETYEKFFVGQSRADAKREFEKLLTQRLGITPSEFHSQCLSLMGITEEAIVREVDKWNFISIGDNKKLESAVNNAVEGAGSNLPIPKKGVELAKSIIGYVVARTINPFENPIKMRTVGYISLAAIATGIVSTVPQIISGGVAIASTGFSLATLGTALPAIGAFYVGASIIGRYVSNCVRKYAIYGNDIPNSYKDVEIIAVKAGNAFFKSLPIRRLKQFYQDLDNSRETAEGLDEAGLLKEKIEVKLFTNERLGEIFGTELSLSTKRALEILRKGINKFPAAVYEEPTMAPTDEIKTRPNEDHH